MIATNKKQELILKKGDVVLTKYIHSGNFSVAVITDPWMFGYKFIIKGKIIECSRFYTSTYIGSDDLLNYINIL